MSPTLKDILKSGGLVTMEIIETFAREQEELKKKLKALQQRVLDAPRKARNEERTRLFRGLGELMDSLGRAIQHSDGVWREGFLGIEAQFVSFFKSEGVEILGTIGEPMNPWLHNAVEISHDTEFQRGQIVQVLRPGFRLQDGAVLRHADVVVAA